MPFQLTDFNVITIGIIAGAFFVLYIRLRKWSDSNVPLIYYGVLIAYVNGSEERLPAWAVYLGVVSTLLLRFEFFNEFVTRAVTLSELSILAGIVYECTMMVLQR